MIIGTVSENKEIEKRISITPEIAKKYISLGFEVSLLEGYGNHLGIKDEEYKKLGTHISKDEKEIPYMTTSIKGDETVKMGIITDVKQELRKANSLKINYSTRKGSY